MAEAPSKESFQSLPETGPYSRQSSVVFQRQPHSFLEETQVEQASTPSSEEAEEGSSVFGEAPEEWLQAAKRAGVDLHGTFAFLEQPHLLEMEMTPQEVEDVMRDAAAATAEQKFRLAVQQRAEARLLQQGGYPGPILGNQYLSLDQRVAAVHQSIAAPAYRYMGRLVNPPPPPSPRREEQPRVLWSAPRQQPQPRDRLGRYTKK